MHINEASSTIKKKLNASELAYYTDTGSVQGSQVLYQAQDTNGAVAQSVI